MLGKPGYGIWPVKQGGEKIAQRGIRMCGAGGHMPALDVWPQKQRARRTPATKRPCEELDVAKMRP